MKALIGFCVGALSTFLLLNWLWEDRSWNYEALTKLVGVEAYAHNGPDNYAFHYEGIWGSPDVYDDVDIFKTIRLDMRTPGLVIDADAIKYLCLSTIEPWETRDTLGLDMTIYLKSALQAQFVTLMKQNANKGFTLTHWGQQLGAFTAIDFVTEHIENNLLPPDKPKPTEETEHGEIKLNPQEFNVREMVWLAKVLSPDAPPETCPGTPRLSAIPWWDYAVRRNWKSL